MVKPILLACIFGDMQNKISFFCTMERIKAAATTQIAIIRIKKQLLREQRRQVYKTTKNSAAEMIVEA
jgi:hypothetical protein